MMFVSDKQAVMREARRVLVRGGLLAFNVWGSLSDNPYARVAYETAARVVGPGPTQFFDVAFGCADVAAWLDLLDAHDFEVQQLEWLKLPVYSPTAERLAIGLVHGTPVRDAIESLGREPDRVTQAVAAALARAGGEAPFRSTMRALVVTATAR
jgi:hypothetical protein